MSGTPTARTPAPLVGDPMCWDCGQGWPGLDTGIMREGSRLCVNCQCPTKREVLTIEPAPTSGSTTGGWPTPADVEFLLEIERCFSPIDVDLFERVHVSTLRNITRVFAALRADLAAALKREAGLRSDIEAYEGLNKQRIEVIDQLFLTEAERDEAIKREGEARSNTHQVALAHAYERERREQAETSAREAKDKYAEAVRERDAAISTMQEAALEARERTARMEQALDAAIDDVAARAEQVWALPSPGALGIASGLRHRRDKLIEARALAPVPTAEAAKEPRGDTGEGESK